MSLKMLFSQISQTISEWLEDDAPTLSAALAYYTVFSMAPLLLICMAIAGFFLGEEAARGQVFAQLSSLIGTDGARAMQDMVQNSGERPHASLIATIVGVVTLLIGASGVFGQLQASLNRIWKVKPLPGGTVRRLIMSRFLSFGFTLAIGFLLLVSLLVSTAVTFVVNWMGGLSPELGVFAKVADILLSLASITFLFALIFKVLPDIHIAWRDVLGGAFLTAALFTIGKFALGWYLGTRGVGSTFGAAGSVVVLLLWVYYSSLILFLGAEWTQVFARRKGAHITPATGSIFESKNHLAEESVAR